MREDTRIKLMVVILDRGKGFRAVELLSGMGLRLHYAAPGAGTANSELLDYLGLGETEKDVVLTLLPGYMVPQVLEAAGERLQLSVPGKGILFTLPLSAIGGAVAQFVSRDAARTETEKEEPVEQEKNDLVVAVVNSGCADAVMEAATAAGARGGTILHGRRVGFESDKAGEGGLRPEKDIVAILLPRLLRGPVMEAVNRQAGVSTESHGVLFALPAEDVLGLSNTEGEQKGR